MSRLPPLAAALALLALPAEAQTARLHVLADSVSIGERFGVAVAVEHGPAVQVLFPEPPAGEALVAAPLRAGEAELLAVRRFPPREHGRTRTDSVVYEAATFALDAARVGPITVRLVRGADTTDLEAPAARLGVRSLVPADSAEPRGLLPLADFPRPLLGPWALAALAVLLAALALLVLRARRRRPALAPALPPLDEMTKRLDALEAAPPDPDPRPFYVELSGALRAYLARALGLPALAQSTDDLLAALEGRAEVPEAALDEFARILRRADLAKFAGLRPDEEARRLDAERARAAAAAIEAEVRARGEKAEAHEAR